MIPLYLNVLGTQWSKKRTRFRGQVRNRCRLTVTSSNTPWCIFVNIYLEPESNDTISIYTKRDFGQIVQFICP